MGNAVKLRLGIVMDPIEHIKTYKDSSFAMLLAAQKRGWQLFYMQAKDLYADSDTAYADCRSLTVEDNPEHWFELGPYDNIELAALDAILMRKDPPFDMEYINTTYMLDLAERAGCLIVNRPNSLRDANEKMFITRFPQCCTPMLVSRNPRRLRMFVEQHKDVILKPLDGMGGMSIFRVSPNDANLSVILETISQHGAKTVMAQCFIPEISAGDKRILLVDGEAVPYALARIPAQGETRGNLAAGGQAVGRELSERDHWICQQVGPVLKDMGILFAGIDVIGDYLTEINITSPTCIRELDSLYKLDIGSQLMDAIAAKRAR
ncbi:MAG: glutathione synthase [Gammaproteobacteria bacterium]